MWAARSDSRILVQPKYRLRAGWRRPKISPHSQRFTGTSRKALGLCHLHNHLHNQTKNMIQIENCNTALMISVKTNPADINWKAIDLRLSFLICRAWLRLPGWHWWTVWDCVTFEGRNQKTMIGHWGFRGSGWNQDETPFTSGTSCYQLKFNSWPASNWTKPENHNWVFQRIRGKP